MSNLETVVQKVKEDLTKGFVFVHMKDHQLRVLVDGLEALQRELDEKDDAISYAMNQIQIKESHIRKMEESREAS